MKQILMTAKTLLNYGGRSYGKNMQFYADRDNAQRFHEGGEAVLASEDEGPTLDPAGTAAAAAAAPTTAPATKKRRGAR